MNNGSGTHFPPTGLELNVELVRRRLDATIRELDRRRQDAFDVKAQIKRHALPVIGACVAFAAAVTAVAVWAIRRRVHRHHLVPRLQRLRSAVSRMVDKPDRVARENPNVVRKIATAAGTTAASMLAKKLMKRAGAGT
jgi:hypothetical protein